MQHPIMDYLEDRHNSLDLLDELQKQVNCNDIENARITAAKIEAIKIIKFDLIKIITEDANKK